MTQTPRTGAALPPGVEAPLQAMAEVNRRLLDQCAALSRLVLAADQREFDTHASAVMRQLAGFFEDELPRHHADQDSDLFPALIESMAGSDAVCLRDITELLAREHRELRRQWLHLGPALEGLATARAQSLPVPEVEAFIERCRACAALEDSELLPMAARLLSDAQIVTLAEAMRRRRSLSPT